MNAQMKRSLMNKYGIKSLSGGEWGDGFMEGIAAADMWHEKRVSGEKK